MKYHEYNQKGLNECIQKKMSAETTLIQNLVFMDTKQYCDTVTISEKLLANGIAYVVVIFVTQ